MFDLNWENKLFFIENMDGNAQCLLCHYVACRFTLDVIKRHYQLCHGGYDEIKGRERDVKVLEMFVSHALYFFSVKQ